MQEGKLGRSLEEPGTCYDCIALVYTAIGNTLALMIVKLSLGPQGLDSNTHHLGDCYQQIAIMG